jgi:hypothetical protein
VVSYILPEPALAAHDAFVLFDIPSVTGADIDDSAGAMPPTVTV